VKAGVWLLKSGERCLREDSGMEVTEDKRKDDIPGKKKKD